MKSKVLEVIDLSKKFEMTNRGNKDFWGLQKINFKGHKGELIGVTGANGSGKTTLFRIVAGIYRPDHGQIINNANTIRSILNIEAGLVNELSGLYNMFHYGALIGISRQEINKKLEEIIEFSELRDFINEPVRSYSTGMKARLAFSVFSSFKSDIFLLDETFSAGDAVFRTRAIERIKHNAKSNNSLLLMISHNAQEIYDHCDSVLGLHNGRKVVQDESQIFHNEYFPGSLGYHENPQILKSNQQKLEHSGKYKFAFYPYRCDVTTESDHVFFAVPTIQRPEENNMFYMVAQFVGLDGNYVAMRLSDEKRGESEDERIFYFSLPNVAIQPESRLHILVLDEKGEIQFTFFNLWNNLTA